MKDGQHSTARLTGRQIKQVCGQDGQHYTSRLTGRQIKHWLDRPTSLGGQRSTSKLTGRQTKCFKQVYKQANKLKAGQHYTAKLTGRQITFNW